MKLTVEEKKICNQYGKEDENKIVHCFECPLAIKEFGSVTSNC